MTIEDEILELIGNSVKVVHMDDIVYGISYDKEDVRACVREMILSGTINLGLKWELSLPKKETHRVPLPKKPKRGRRHTPENTRK